MAVFRVNKTRDYTVMSNHHLKDKTLTLKSKGLLSQILSLPDNWDYSVNGLAAINRESITAIRTALKELAEHGYIVITKLTPDKTESGRFEYVYDVYEIPEKQDIEKQGIENLYVENHTQLNTKEQNTNNKINRGFQPPSLEEVQAYCKERNNKVDPERFINFYESKGWMVGKNKMKNWKACVRTWEQRDKGNKTRLQDRHDYDYNEIEKRLFGDDD